MCARARALVLQPAAPLPVEAVQTLSVWPVPMSPSLLERSISVRARALVLQPAAPLPVEAVQTLSVWPVPMSQSLPEHSIWVWTLALGPTVARNLQNDRAKSDSSRRNLRYRPWFES